MNERTLTLKERLDAAIERGATKHAAVFGAPAAKPMIANVVQAFTLSADESQAGALEAEIDRLWVATAKRLTGILGDFLAPVLTEHGRSVQKQAHAPRPNPMDAQALKEQTFQAGNRAGWASAEIEFLYSELKADERIATFAPRSATTSSGREIDRAYLREEHMPVTFLKAGRDRWLGSLPAIPVEND